jgi:pimeloyl-ACP methyl ester carboxylesterase
MSPPLATIVLVHGAWHASWCWERVVPLLQRRGLTVRTVDLPSVGARPGAGIDLSADAAVVERVVAEVGGPVVLCGHSYGGMVISRVEAKNVARLVYLCAFMPAEGEALVSFGDGKQAPWIQMLDGGLLWPDPAQADTVFYSRCDAETRRWARSKLRPQSVETTMESVQRPAWRNAPSTYVVCAQDMALPADVQRNVFVPRATESVELQADHSPFLSQPGTLAGVLVERASLGRQQPA